jgi:hypothetical protein
MPDAATALEPDAASGQPDAAGPADTGTGGSGGAGGSAGGGEALMVVGAVPIIGSDVQIHDELVARGLAVTEVLDSSSTAAMAAGKKIVVLSYSIDSEQIGAKFADVDASVILMEHNLLGTMGMTSASGHGYQDPAVTLSIVKADHPLAAGLTGDVTVIGVKGEMFWGMPSDSAIKIATIKGNAARVVLFGYEAGAMMVGRKAAGKRLQFFLGAHLVPTKYLNADGLKLLDAAIDWCAK